MGIKGIYKEIGPGKRISLTKLTVDYLEETGRPFRLAIDISIWQFQAQAARGGSNPAIRTLFYRLLRLLSLCIQPIFVFDGPNKPAFKRNKRAGRGDGVATSMAKRLIRLFGFLVHDAPGEAEAECALLQQQGVVDAVLSEDVDTIMFGCGRTLRNWSAEGANKAKTPTHVSMYDAEGLRRGDSGLDREGMVLVALMSGGDYVTEGIPGAGVKLACEAARAGFGKRLCQLKRSDTSGLNSWREWLLYELRTNESGFFRTKHKALHVPDSFPNLDVLRYYTHPVVSPAEVVERLRAQEWEKPVDVQGLREFGRETFDWNYRVGAVKFIRVLAPCLLVRKLMDRSTRSDSRPEDIDSVQEEESSLVGAIKSRRAHASTDETPELRLSFIPTDIVGYDFQEEPDEVISYGRDGLALNSDDDFDAVAEDEARPAPKKPFSPTEPDLHWVPETIAKFGVPLMVEDWEARQRVKKGSSARQKPKASKQQPKSGGPAGRGLDKFVRVTKNIPKDTDVAGKPDNNPPPSQPEESTPSTTRTYTRARNSINSAIIPSQRLPSSSSIPSSQQPEKTKPHAKSSKPAKPSKSILKATAASARRKPAATEEQPSTVNPWTIASSQVTPRKAGSASTHNHTYVAGNKQPAARDAPSETIIISSSPLAPPTTSPQQQHGQQPPSTPSRKEARSGIRIPSSPPPFSSPPADNPSPPRNKRRSITPPPASPQPGSAEPGTPTPGYRRAVGTPPLSSERPRRKLARTESMPVESPASRTNVGAGADRPTTSKRSFARAQTIAVAAETMVLSSDSEESEDQDGGGHGGEKEDEDSDLDDLPPINSLLRKAAGGDAAGGMFTPSPERKLKRAPSTNGTLPTTPTRHRQTTLDSPEAWRGRGVRVGAAGDGDAKGKGNDNGRPRMTKLYVPRKSQPGFFKEVDVTADEAEALKAHVAGADTRGSGQGRGRAWRRSDIQCVDLTGED